MKGEALGGPNPLAHEPIVIANVVQHLVSFEVVHSNSVLWRRTSEEGGAGVDLTGVHRGRRGGYTSDAPHETRVPYSYVAGHTA